MAHSLCMASASSIKYIANMRMPTEKAHGIQIMKTCEALSRAGAKIELIVPSRHSAITEDPFTYYGVSPVFTIIRVPVFDLVWMGRIGFILESLSFAFSALFYLLTSRNGEGVVYSRDELPLWIVHLFKREVVWESHTGAHNFFARRFMHAGEKVVVISHGLKDLYLSQKSKADICVAPDGIDVHAFAESENSVDVRTQLGIPQSTKVVMYIGRLDGWKGVGTLLEASTSLGDGIQVVVIGGEPAQVGALRAGYPRVLFLGYRPYTELASNQAAADVLVLPNTGKDEISARYTSPMKLFSYMASGKPIVASDLPSIREILHEKNAMFFTADDPQALASAIKIALSNPEAKGLGEQAKKDVLSYTWDARAKTILELIEK